MEQNELIECLKSFIRSNHLTNEWNIFRDNWSNEINSAQGENSSVSDNESEEKITTSCIDMDEKFCDKYFCCRGCPYE
jgi:hypothetical protein